jgi:hypothetical protein
MRVTDADWWIGFALGLNWVCLYRPYGYVIRAISCLTVIYVHFRAFEVNGFELGLLRVKLGLIGFVFCI